jgi:hypothetical protein
MADNAPGKITESPTCNCLLLCDDVLISGGRGKHYLQGVIGMLGAAEFPATIGGCVAYIRLSNVYADQKVSINLLNTRTEEIIFEFEAGFPDRSDPLGVYTLVVPIPPFVIAEPGRYLFNALHNNAPIAQSPIVVKGPPGEREEQ